MPRGEIEAAEERGSKAYSVRCFKQRSVDVVGECGHGHRLIGGYGAEQFLCLSAKGELHLGGDGMGLVAGTCDVSQQKNDARLDGDGVEEVATPAIGMVAST